MELMNWKQRESLAVLSRYMFKISWCARSTEMSTTFRERKLLIMTQTTTQRNKPSYRLKEKETQMRRKSTN